MATEECAGVYARVCVSGAVLLCSVFVHTYSPTGSDVTEGGSAPPLLLALYSYGCVTHNCSRHIPGIFAICAPLHTQVTGP